MTKLRTFQQTSLLLVLCMAAAMAQTPVFTELAHLSPYPHPYAGVVQGTDGQLHSTTAGAGSTPGQVFRITTAGDLTTIVRLPGESEAGLVLATNGNYYGTTLKGGGNGGGSVFEVTPAGKHTILHSFCLQAGCPDGLSPQGPLIQANDGNLYGTTTQGGPGCMVYDDDCGTVFKMTLAGDLTTLYTFCLQSGCPDGNGPHGNLLQASDGNLYGVAGGGSAREGMLFRLTLSGVLTTIYSFCTQSGCPDGADPKGGLVQGADGALYGTTQSYPTVFRITLGGDFQVLYNFCFPSTEDCGALDDPLISATDGNLYGTVQSGGFYREGAIFSITTSGSLTTLYSFCPVRGCSDGFGPMGAVFQATDGNFYGTTYGAKGSGPGTVYRLSMGLAPFVTPLPTYGKARAKITILGMGLTGATAVSFNGTPASSFTVNSTGSAIKATVPNGAATGSITVTLANGSTLTSNVPFQVQ